MRAGPRYGEIQRLVRSVAGALGHDQVHQGVVQPHLEGLKTGLGIAALGGQERDGVSPCRQLEGLAYVAELLQKRDLRRWRVGIAAGKPAAIGGYAGATGAGAVENP